MRPKRPKKELFLGVLGLLGFFGLSGGRAEGDRLCYNVEMVAYYRLCRLLALAVMLLPSTAFGQGPRRLMVDIGTRFNLLTIAYRILVFMAGAASILCAVLFLAGAVYITASRGKDDMVQKGKDLIIGSVFGFAVVLGSYAILRTVYYFIYVL